MVKTVLNTVKSNLVQTAYYDDVFPFVETVTIDGVSRPMYYLGDGHYDDVFNPERNFAYVRKAGTTQFSEDTRTESRTSCVTDFYVIDVTIPLRVVSCIRREILPCDDAFVDEAHVLELIKSLSGNPAGLAVDIDAYSARFNPRSSTTDREGLFREEVSADVLKLKTGIEYRIPAEFSFVAVELDVNIKIERSCLVKQCNYG